MRWLGMAALAAMMVTTGCGNVGSEERTVSHAVRLACDGGRHGARLAPADGAWFGVNLDWTHDSPDAYSARLGRSPAVYTQFVQLPMTAAEETWLDEAVAAIRKHDAMLLLTLEPHAGLDAVTDTVISALAERLRLINESGVPVFLRFAHEMNGSWYAWSQQPAAYVATFRRLAEAVRARAPQTAMLWAPNYGGGYPFRGGRHVARSGSRDAAVLDTNGDGAIDMRDDPYAPFYPGDDVVDWVGMSLYHWGNDHPWGSNDMPEPGKFRAMLTGRYHGLIGDERSLPDFHADYGIARNKPVGIFETAALFAPAANPVDELQLKSLWWSQAYADDLSELRALRMINWFEWNKFESEIDARVDWTATNERTVAAFRNALPDWLRFADAVDICRAG